MAKENGKTPIEPEVHYPEQIIAHYSNRAELFISNSDIIIDFVMVEPASHGKKPKLVFQTRVILSPQHAKQLSIVLSQNIEKYEETFGPINLAPVKK
jgi:hypothetical protein